jgi:hypothetical protein
MACTLSRSDRVDPQVLHQFQDFSSSPSFLLDDDIPTRTDDRPQCESCLPHAQMTHQSPDLIMEELKQKAVQLLGSAVTVGKSTVSMPSTFPAFHLNCSSCTCMPKEACMTPGGRGTEFAHIHARYFPNDSEFAQSNAGRRWQEWQGGGQGSMHLCLTLKDAATVLQKGWGERHVLAGNPNFPVPRGLLLVYAPNTTEEVEVVLKMLRAAFLFAQQTTTTTTTA